MNTDSLKLIRNILLRTFVIAVLVAWSTAALTILCWDTWTNMMAQWFRMPAAEMGVVMGSWFALIKFYMIFVLLVPALGLHWEIKQREKQSIQ